MMSSRYLTKLHNQQGMALVLSMLILAAAAVVALSLGLDTTLETRIAGNQKTTQEAFFNAEAGLQRARLVLASEFASAPSNLIKIRSGAQPDWGFLFASGVPSTDSDSDPSLNEKLISLTSSNYKVFASDPQYPSENGAIITLRSIGFGPGGARQIVEESVLAKGNGSQSGYYAQQGGGSTKANTNPREIGKVGDGQVDMGGTRR